MTVLKADVTAADRLLKAAVRYAVESFRYWGDAAYDCADVVEVLAHAGYGATLLLADDERPAKKAAKRAPRKAGS